MMIVSHKVVTIMNMSSNGVWLIGRVIRYKITLVYSFRVKIAVIARRFLPKQSLGFQKIASLRSVRNDSYKITLNEYKSAAP